jgi:hypothetical protein
VLGVRLIATVVKSGEAPGVATSVVTFDPPICGFGFKAVAAYTTPRCVIGEPPSLVTVPPRIALLAVTFAIVGALTIGATGPTGIVKKVEAGLVYVVPR